MNKDFDLENSVFTYIVAPFPVDVFPKHQLIFQNILTISCSPKTDIQYFENQEKAIAIIGFCIDSHKEIERHHIPNEAISQDFTCIEDVYRWFDRFAGKYVVIYKDFDDIYVWGDATCSIPINYTVSGFDFFISSSDTLIAKYNNFSVSDYSRRIRLASDLSQALPWNITMYDSIKALLPNHYLSLSSHNAQRVPLCVNDDTHVHNFENILSQSLNRITNIASEYTRYYDFACPLTSGYDSRVVFSILNSISPNFDCYTFRHSYFKPNEGDIVIPREICKQHTKKHIVIDDILAPQDYINKIQNYLGEYTSEKYIHIAYTYNSTLSEFAQINGDIIDQVGKSLIGNNTPNFLAIPSFFQCKIHNRSNNAKKEIKKHINSINTTNEKKKVFDLFAIESRCGRWASQTSQIYSTCGITSLNFFNCRELIALWTSLPRSIRTKKQIHNHILKTLSPALLHIPFNPGAKVSNALKGNWLTFFIATYIKQYIFKG